MIFKTSPHIFAILLGFTFTSCASKKIENPPKVYSQETQKTFEEIERERVIENYRKLREQDWKQRERVRDWERQRPIQLTPKPAPAKKTSAPPKASSSYKKVDTEESRIEIEQNISFFCMKMRTTQRFTDEEQCKSYAQGIYYDCQQKFNADNPKLISCVKSGLK